MNISRDRFSTLKELRPVTSVQDAWQSEDRDALLRQVLVRADELGSSSEPVVNRPRVPRRRLVLAAALVAVLGTAVAVPFLETSPTYAATPPMLHFELVAGQQSTLSVLTGLAGRAQTQPQPSGHGRYHYIHTKGWYLHESADVKKGVFEAGIDELDRQMWLAPDGSGRLLRKASDGSTPMINPDKILKPGEFDGSFLSPDAPDASVLAKYSHAATAAGWAHTIEELWNRQVVPPALQARLLRTLAAQAGVTLLGDTTDRVGRNGLAVSVEDHGSPAERLILVLDPETGALLDAETVVLEDSDLPVQPPATIAYTVWIGTNYAENTASQS